MFEPELRFLLSDKTVGTPVGRIVRVLSERGTMSATAIAKVTGMAKSTVSTALTELRRSDIVVDGEGQGNGGGVGRPATAISLNPRAGTAVGILIGLQHIRVVVADVSHAVLAQEKIDLEPDYSPAHAAALAKDLIERCYREQGLSRRTRLGVGIALAAPINPLDGRVLRAGGVPTWAGVDLKSVFEPVLKQPIVADNESNCSAIAEMMWGAAQGYEDFVMFTVDFGVGGAIVHRGRVMTGIAGGAGEFGHMSINPEGPLCRCGNRGCLELYASLRRPVASASRHFKREVGIKEMISLAKAGDDRCRQLIADTAEAAGRGLGLIGSAINPGLVVVGGGIALAGDLFLLPLEESYDRHTLVKRRDVGAAGRTRFATAKFGETDACMGAVGLVLRRNTQADHLTLTP